MELRKLGVGCKVAGVYMGALGFCDDLVLLAPTRDAMQLMLDTCQRFATRFNLQFSTDQLTQILKRLRLNAYLFVAGQRLGKNLLIWCWSASSFPGWNQLYTLAMFSTNLAVWKRISGLRGLALLIIVFK